MANNYESLKTDGHYTMAYKIFTKIKSWILTFAQYEIDNPSTVNYTFTSTDQSVYLSPGAISSLSIDNYGMYHDHVVKSNDLSVRKVNGHTVESNVPSNAVFTDTIYTAGDNVSISQQNVISSDQIEDSYNYTQYEALPSSTKMQDKLFIVDDAPMPVFFEYDELTKSIIFTNGYASYDEDTNTVTIGG